MIDIEYYQPLMGTYSLLLVILPLLIFVLVDTFASQNIALLAAAIAAVGECLFSFYYMGELDSFSIFSIFLVFLLAAISFFKKSKRIFYLKPAILSFGMGVFLLVTFFNGKFVLFDGMMKYGSLLSGENALLLDNPGFHTILKNSSLTVGIACLIHGGLSTYAALKLSRWWWFVVAGLSGYGFLFAGVVAAMLI